MHNWLIAFSANDEISFNFQNIPRSAAIYGRY